jgi:hypothetical protein
MLAAQLPNLRKDVIDPLLSSSIPEILEVDALPEAVEEDGDLLGVSAALPETAFDAK